MSKQENVQDTFLAALCEERVPVSIFLISGIRLQGTIDSFDRFTVKLKNVVVQIVNKHAISTVLPSRNIRIPLPEIED